jgi:hypothetical protein
MPGEADGNHEKPQSGKNEENHKTLVRAPGLQTEIMNPGPPEYEAGVLTIRPRHLVVNGHICIA